MAEVKDLASGLLFPEGPVAMSDGSVIARRRTNVDEVQIVSLGLKKGAIVGIDARLRKCLLG